jgi:hypothetical protein
MPNTSHLEALRTKEPETIEVKATRTLVWMQLVYIQTQTRQPPWG